MRTGFDTFCKNHHFVDIENMHPFSIASLTSKDHEHNRRRRTTVHVPGQVGTSGEDGSVPTVRNTPSSRTTITHVPAPHPAHQTTTSPGIINTPAPVLLPPDQTTPPSAAISTDNAAKVVRSLEREMGEEVSSSSSVHSPPAEKPPHSYIALITMAVLASPRRQLLLADIYQYIIDRFPYYNNEERAWRNSIRHNLSLNACFIKCGRADNGKGHYWGIHPSCVDEFSRGDFRRRHARRRPRRAMREGDVTNTAVGGAYSYRPYSVPYVPMSHHVRTVNNQYVPSYMAPPSGGHFMPVSYPRVRGQCPPVVGQMPGYTSLASAVVSNSPVTYTQQQVPSHSSHYLPEIRSMTMPSTVPSSSSPSSLPSFSQISSYGSVSDPHRIQPSQFLYGHVQHRK